MTVLRSGGDFNVSHVQALDRQLQKYAPLYEHICLSDVDVPGVKCQWLKYKWPGWWAKMELFRPDIVGTVLFLDLDTVIVGPLDDILKQRKLTMLRDFYRDGTRLKEGLGGGLMLLPEQDRTEPWDYFSKHPETYMRTYPRGEQHLLETYYLSHAQRWQDVVPGQVVSWKVHCNGGNVFKLPRIPSDARLVAFHGQPRPWQTDKFKDLY